MYRSVSDYLTPIVCLDATNGDIIWQRDMTYVSGINIATEEKEYTFTSCGNYNEVVNIPMDINKDDSLIAINANSQGVHTAAVIDPLTGQNRYVMDYSNYNSEVMSGNRITKKVLLNKDYFSDSAYVLEESYDIVWNDATTWRAVVGQTVTVKVICYKISDGTIKGQYVRMELIFICFV
jgi:hypothetical protein